MCSGWHNAQCKNSLTAKQQMQQICNAYITFAVISCTDADYFEYLCCEQLYICTVEQLNSCKVVKLYSCTEADYYEYLCCKQLYSPQ